LSADGILIGVSTAGWLAMGPMSVAGQPPPAP